MRTQALREHEEISSAVEFDTESSTQNEVEGSRPSGAFHFLTIDRVKNIHYITEKAT